jgi:hypothetical protein
VNITQVNPFWAPAIPGSKWIGPISSGVQPQAGGIYIYSFRFCLCPLPNGVSTIPANLSFHVYADDAFTAKLNGNVIGQKLTGWSFTSASPPAPAGQAAAPGGTVVNATASFKCDNVLTFEVQNGGTNPTPTGLDVYGTISGYFGQPAFPSAGQPCPCAASHEPTA